MFIISMCSAPSSPTDSTLSLGDTVVKEIELKKLETTISEIEHELKSLSFAKVIEEVTAKSDDRKAKHDERVRYALKELEDSQSTDDDASDSEGNASVISDTESLRILVDNNEKWIAKWSKSREANISSAKDTVYKRKEKLVAELENLYFQKKKVLLVFGEAEADIHHITTLITHQTSTASSSLAPGYNESSYVAASNATKDEEIRVLKEGLASAKIKLDEAIKSSANAELELKEEKMDQQIRNTNYKQHVENLKKDIANVTGERGKLGENINHENIKQKELVDKANSERDKAVADLQAEKSAHESKKAKVNQLSERIKWMNPIFNIGVAASKGRKEMMRRCWNGSEFEEIEGRGSPDISIIKDRNTAVHEGNIDALTSLFRLGLLVSKSDRAFHKAEYGLEVNEGLSSSKLREIANMKGTMFGCFSWTKHSHSRPDDNLFLEYFNECRKIYDDALTDCSGKEDAAAAKFDSNSIIPSRINRMKQIMDRTVNKERARRHDH